MDRFERRLEAVLREIGRMILQATLRQIETDDPAHVPARLGGTGGE